MGKGQNAGKQYFLLFPQCFLPHQRNIATTPRKKPIENIVGKGQNAGKQHFLLFPQCFLPCNKNYTIFSHIEIVVCKCFHFGQGLNCVVWYRIRWQNLVRGGSTDSSDDHYYNLSRKILYISINFIHILPNLHI